MVTIGLANIPRPEHGVVDEAARGSALGLPAGLVRSALASPGLLKTGLLNAVQLQGREDARGVVASGFAAVDRLLPAGGLRRGSLVEWLAGGETAAGDVAGGAGAVSLALAVAFTFDVREIYIFKY